MGKILFFDTEIHPRDGRVLDIGALSEDGAQLHTPSLVKFSLFLRGASYLCGHNILAHDLRFVGREVKKAAPQAQFIDTLCLSPLLFPQKPYHRLVKDDKLYTEERSNPLNDARKAQTLFHDEVNAFSALPPELQEIYTVLLSDTPQFSGFFHHLGRSSFSRPGELIFHFFHGRLCEYADVEQMAQETPVELAYALALIQTGDRASITPPWVVRQFPRVTEVIQKLRGRPCRQGCPYCRKRLDVRRSLKEIFGFERFRSYDGEPLQERAAEAAVAGESLLAVFPTGGGKSVTFQLPALMAGEAERGLTVVISPLQSLMKDQVDNLEQRGIVDAVTVNGLLDPIQRRDALERVENGMATLLYISPESLRSKTIERLLISRNVVRFVIDEAHCFSAWGQDFRVDYLYIGDFIRQLQQKKGLKKTIPVSCFTATAKQKVISDIQDYFRSKLGLELKRFATGASRENLHYAVLYKETEEEKYLEARRLIESRDCPTIVYVSRVRRTQMLAQRLRADGFSALAYNGKMESTDKVAAQNAFLQGETQIIVATSAFGMGVDKKDVGLVIHYDISDSLENYVQEAGRAGRDTSIEADCFVLFNDSDLDKHFLLLNQTKLSISEIQQVWRAVKELTRQRDTVSCSALELARQAGWDEEVRDIETRVTTAVAALEQAGYLVRGQNCPHVYADSILAANLAQAAERIDASPRFNDREKKTAKLTMGFLISRRSTQKNTGEDAESRVDYIADRLGVEKGEIIQAVNLLREEELLADHMDLSAHIRRTDTQNRSERILKHFLKLEKFLMENLPEESFLNFRELNERAIQSGIKGARVKDLRTIVFYWTISGILRKHLGSDEQHWTLERTAEAQAQRESFERRAFLAERIIHCLYEKSTPDIAQGKEEALVQFSVLELQKVCQEEQSLFLPFDVTGEEVQQTLLYLSKIQALTLEGGFLVSYNSMQLRRLEKDNRIQYKQEDYRQLNDFYQQRIQQIHIVGEYAHLMVRNYHEALGFVSDYFLMDYRAFLAKYFKGNRKEEINRNITVEKYQQLFGSLSQTQREIIDDKSRCIVVAAGPGSGKTMVLVHKLASLLLLEDVKHEQLLMLTFSRSAAIEFKQRLIQLIGNAAHFVDVKTFHSYCFDLLGRVGSLKESENVVRQAAKLLSDGGAEASRITKTVLVIDEAQDMDEHEYALVRGLMAYNEGMRVIAVGDDDQNIYQFRGSDSRHFRDLLTRFQAKRYELLDNYRSAVLIVEASNAVAATLKERMKSQPIRPVSSQQGTVTLTQYEGGRLEQPVAEEVCKSKGGGSCCVLTATNQEALCVQALLQRWNVPSRLIQSMDGFDLYHLAELRYFLKQLESEQAVLGEKVWKGAKEALKLRYQNSNCLSLCLRILETYESINPTKYRSDFELFLHESKIEDFSEDKASAVIVSTLHKAKGREFERVWLVLRGYDFASEEKKRAVYVGMTRAKSELHIHTDSSFFHALLPQAVERRVSYTVYPEPQELLLELGHRDVVLDFFKDKKSFILRLRSGEAVTLEGAYLSARGRFVAKLSQSCWQRLEGLKQNGYRVHQAQVRYVVAWKGEQDTEETAVMLPTLKLRKGDQV